MAEPVHTQFAMKAIDLASVFKSVVGAEPVASTSGPSFQVELSAPDGPSTGGGAQSVQHIRLVREGMTVVAGSIDSVQRSVELRSYAYACGLHAQRYKGAPLPISQAAYDAMLKRIRTFVASQDYAVVLKDAAPLPVAAKPASGGSMMMILGAIAVVAAVAGAVYFFMLHR
jgi:hypothetical protein